MDAPVGAPSNGLTYRQHLILGVSITTMGLAMISYALRLYAKRITAAKVWWDDYVIGIGLFFAIIPCITNFVGLRYGFGRHVSELPDSYPRNYFICLYTLLLAWIIAETVIKFGILLFYWRVFPGKHFRWSIYAVGALFMMCFIAGFIGFVLQCIPVRGFWEPKIQPTCLKEQEFFNATAALGLIGDVILLIQPLPIIWRLKASRQTRLGLCFVFLTGGVVVVISAFRLAALGGINPHDITWTNVGPGLWTSAEVTIGVVSANLPFMRPILGKAWSKAHDFRTAYKENDNHTGTEDRQNLRANGFTRITDDKARSLMGLTSTAQPGRDSHALDFELGIPMHRIAVTTDVDRQVEEIKEPKSVKLVPQGMQSGNGKPAGWIEQKC